MESFGLTLIPALNMVTAVVVRTRAFDSGFADRILEINARVKKVFGEDPDPTEATPT